MNANPKAVIVVLKWPAGWDKVLRQLFKGLSLINDPN
jgi:hypothetical protein